MEYESYNFRFAEEILKSKFPDVLKEIEHVISHLEEGGYRGSIRERITQTVPCDEQTQLVVETSPLRKEKGKL